MKDGECEFIREDFKSAVSSYLVGIIKIFCSFVQTVLSVLFIMAVGFTLV